LGEAYEVLKDRKKRVAYDQLGADWKADKNFRPSPDWNKGFKFNTDNFTGGSGIYSDFLNNCLDMHLNKINMSSTRMGETVMSKFIIDIECSVRGSTRNISLSKPEIDAQSRSSTA
jgi:curved DNA-binding protein